MAKMEIVVEKAPVFCVNCVCLPPLWPAYFSQLILSRDTKILKHSHYHILRDYKRNKTENEDL